MDSKIITIYKNTLLSCMNWFLLWQVLFLFTRDIMNSHTFINVMLGRLSVRREEFKLPLSPNIHIQILQTGLHTFPLRMSWENLTKDQSIFSLVSILLILITFSLANVWIPLGENWCWSLLRRKGLKMFPSRLSLPAQKYLGSFTELYDTCTSRYEITLLHRNYSWSLWLIV